MWNLLGKKDPSTSVKLPTVEEGFGQQVLRELFCLAPSFLGVKVDVEGGSGLFHILIHICVVCVILYGCKWARKRVEQLC